MVFDDEHVSARAPATGRADEPRTCTYSARSDFPSGLLALTMTPLRTGLPAWVACHHRMDRDVRRARPRAGSTGAPRCSATGYAVSDERPWSEPPSDAEDGHRAKCSSSGPPPCFTARGQLGRRRVRRTPRGARVPDEGRVPRARSGLERSARQARLRGSTNEVRHLLTFPSAGKTRTSNAGSSDLRFDQIRAEICGKKNTR